MRLETERLVLREFNKNDIDDIVEILNNIEISKWLIRIPYPYTKEEAQKFIRICIEKYNSEDKKDYIFAIELKLENKVIGITNLGNINKIQGTASCGMSLNEKYHSKGYGTEALNKITEFAFETLDLRRLENIYIKGNEASFKMQEKLGYKIEGMKRQGILCLADDTIKDAFITGLLKEEWKKID